jgi:hypothetical protein
LPPPSNLQPVLPLFGEDSCWFIYSLSGKEPWDLSLSFHPCYLLFRDVFSLLCDNKILHSNPGPAIYQLCNIWQVT